MFGVRLYGSEILHDMAFLSLHIDPQKPSHVCTMAAVSLAPGYLSHYKAQFSS